MAAGEVENQKRTLFSKSLSSFDWNMWREIQMFRSPRHRSRSPRRRSRSPRRRSPYRRPSSRRPSRRSPRRQTPEYQKRKSSSRSSSISSCSSRSHSSSSSSSSRSHSLMKCATSPGRRGKPKYEALAKGMMRKGGQKSVSPDKGKSPNDDDRYKKGNPNFQKRRSPFAERRRSKSPAQVRKERSSPARHFKKRGDERQEKRGRQASSSPSPDVRFRSKAESGSEEASEQEEELLSSSQVDE